MKTISEVREILSGRKRDLHEKYHVKNIGVFGSFARNEQTEKSDVDILVDFEEPIGLDFVSLAEYLEQLLGMKVDLVSRGAIKPARLKVVEEDLIYV